MLEKTAEQNLEIESGQARIFQTERMVHVLTPSSLRSYERSEDLYNLLHEQPLTEVQNLGAAIISNVTQGSRAFNHITAENYAFPNSTLQDWRLSFVS